MDFGLAIGNHRIQILNKRYLGIIDESTIDVFVLQQSIHDLLLLQLAELAEDGPVVESRRLSDAHLRNIAIRRSMLRKYRVGVTKNSINDKLLQILPVFIVREPLPAHYPAHRITVEH